MKFIILTFAMIAACSALDSSLDRFWDEFKQKYNKEYASNDMESQRRAIWEDNLNYINNHNLEASLGKHTFTAAMNKFGDLTNAEFVNMMNGFNKTGDMKKLSGSTFLKPSNVEIPDEIDWRTLGGVTPVGNQQQCGSCWAFTAVAALEGQHFRASGKLVALSTQNLMDCSTSYGNMGCNGGLMDQAFAYIKDNNGIDTDDSYPYIARQNDKCLFNRANVGATDFGFTDIMAGDEEAIKAATATIGPISIAFDASQGSFQWYHDGVYSDTSCRKEYLDHSATIVGYGTTQDGQDYWIVKNSWGTDWGMQGYVLFARGSNMCGIAQMASYPLV